MVILTLDLPDEDGVEFCRRFRALTRARIHVLTSEAEAIPQVAEKVPGVDDYLIKPFSSGKALARVRASFYSRALTTPVPPAPPPQRMRDLVVDRH